MIDEKKLLDHLEQIRSSLQELSDRDFGGGFTSEHVGKLRMVKYIIGAINRKEFDMNKQEIIIDTDEIVGFLYRKLNEEGIDLNNYNLMLLADIFFEFLIEKKVTEEELDEKEIRV